MWTFHHMLDSLNLEALRRVGLSLSVMQHLQQHPREHDEHLMRVTELQRDALSLHDVEQEVPGRVMASLTRELQGIDETLAVGDWVLARCNPLREWWVGSRIAPVTQIARRIHDGGSGLRRQVLVSNVDTVVLVMGLDHDFNLRRLERYIALVRHAGVSAVLALTKADACSLRACADKLSQAREALPADIMAIALDARDGHAREALAPWLGAAQTLVLMGSSGAGKSTLTNTLLQSTTQWVGAARHDDSRGRHTTTARSLHVTPCGACIIDTPGLRALRLDLGDAGDVTAAFGDIAQHAGQCRFRDCRHVDEPGCAVRDAVQPERLRNFHKLQREVRRDSLTIFQRREQLSKWKAMGRAGREGLAAKRGGR